LAIHTTAPKITDLAPELPSQVDAWFAKACARKRDARFTSPRDAAAAFAAAIDGKDYASSVEASEVPESSRDVADGKGHSSGKIEIASRSGTGAAATLSSTLARRKSER